MDILRIKLFVAKPEYYSAQSNNKGDGISKYSDGNRGNFFKTSFHIPVNAFQDVFIKCNLRIPSMTFIEFLLRIQ